MHFHPVRNHCRDAENRTDHDPMRVYYHYTTSRYFNGPVHVCAFTSRTACFGAGIRYPVYLLPNNVTDYHTFHLNELVREESRCSRKGPKDCLCSTRFCLCWCSKGKRCFKRHKFEVIQPAPLPLTVGCPCNTPAIPVSVKELYRVSPKNQLPVPCL